MLAAQRIGTATLALTALCALVACADRSTGSASASPSVAASPPAAASPSPTPVAGSVGGLPGWSYYLTDEDNLVRLTRSAPVTVLRSGRTARTCRRTAGPPGTSPRTATWWSPIATAGTRARW